MKKILLFLPVLLITFISFIPECKAGWFPLSSGTSASLYSVNFPSSGAGNLGFIAGASGTILVTTNAGSNWNFQSTNFANDFESVCFINSLTGWACGSNGTIIYSSNGGANWSFQTTPSIQMLWSIYFINSLTGWSCGQNGQIFYTTNGGLNWVIEMSTTPEYLRSVFFTDASNGICSGRNGKIIKTTNAGANWYDVGPSLTSTLYAVSFINPSTGWAAGFGTVKTTNGGSNWFIQQTSGIILSVNFPSATTGWEVGADGAANYTTNAGANWVSQNLNVVNWLYGIQFTSLSVGYIVGDNGLIFKTTDGGGLINEVVPIGGNIPDRFLLYQNYPNPFNPNTVVRFQVAAYGLVKLKIYDMLGREITKLVNEIMEPGSYTVDWNAEDYPSGIYFYSLKAGDYSESRKMMLLK